MEKQEKLDVEKVKNIIKEVFETSKEMDDRITIDGTMIHIKVFEEDF